MASDLAVPAGAQPTTVDSSVRFDVVTDDPTWGAWSRKQLARAADAGRLVIDALIYAEVSVSFDRIETLDAVLPLDTFKREQRPFEAGFLAGKAFLNYRRRGGERRWPLPDFYIGAHALVRDHALLTRDPSRVRTAFPALRLTTP